ncbi:MAG TPA: peroxidase family protein [Methylocella sp.]|nr:peroxidase family protein [Methylocella sp.]
MRSFWDLVNRIPFLARLLNKLLVNCLVRKAPARPLPLSTLNSYTSWHSLTDRTFFDRYLPPQEPRDLPPVDTVVKLFATAPNGPKLSERSTLLFPVFAQWFTDGWLLTDDTDRTKTKSPHQIDLNPLYGLTEDVTQSLRRLSNVQGERGQLKSEFVNGEEWAPRLYLASGEKNPKFASVPDPARLPRDIAADRRASLFAFGGERANGTTFTAMMNTLFLREHNRLCRLLERTYPAWDDERVFQTARNINIVLVMKIAVEEYINHISSAWLSLLFEPAASYRAEWNRPNWIPIEFNLLYRWHSLVPEKAKWHNDFLEMDSFEFDNTRLLQDGLGCGFDSASNTAARKLGLFNTPHFLMPVEGFSIKQGRDNKLGTYNDYRETFRYPRVTRFAQITSDPQVIDGLRQVYGHVDNIEFFVGIFAEDIPPRLAVTPLIMRMVAVDAFSHLLTNPLLAPLVYHEKTFSPEGMATIKTTSSFRDLLERNIPQPPGTFKITMERDGTEFIGC